mgnify:FL=1|jgi:uncharacterized LabA/DUF88 family protein
MKEKNIQDLEKLSSLFSNQRVGVFVDVQNMFYSAKKIKHAKLNFSKLMQKAVGSRQLIRAISYVVDNPEIDQSGFIDMLTGNGFEIKSKPLRVRADGSAKADWDMGIAIDAVTLASKLDVIVLVSGDGDFTHLVYHLQSQGVFVEIISFPESTHDELIKSADKYNPIDDTLLIKSRRN